jgi:hypothetical protein
MAGLVLVDACFTVVCGHFGPSSEKVEQSSAEVMVSTPPGWKACYMPEVITICISSGVRHVAVCSIRAVHDARSG